MSWILPAMLALLVAYAFFKKVNVYGSFVAGAKEALSLCVGLFPFLCAIFVLVELMKASGVLNLLQVAFSPVLSWLGVPSEITHLVLLRPFSGSGSLAVAQQIFEQYGVDSYPSRCAAVLMGSSETVFYLSTVYFSQTKVKKLGIALPLALVCSLLTAVLSCFFVRLFP